MFELGLNVYFFDNIYYFIYCKVCVNGIMNGLCIILDVNMVELGKILIVYKMVVMIVNEFVKVVVVEKIELDVLEVIVYCEFCFDLEIIGLYYFLMY